MRYAFTTEPAEFVERPNRYLVHARLHGSGAVVRAHCPDPGRLRELLIPGATIHVSEAIEGPPRTTSHTLRFVEHPECGVLVSMESCMANRLFQEALGEERLDHFGTIVRVEREVRLPLDSAGPIRSRIDYRLTDDSGMVTWIEVKSATLVVDGTAYFPDAVTERGRRHASELQEVAQRGERAAICFVIQRPDAVCFRPQWDRDPALALALLDAARAGVEVYAFVASVSLTEARIERQIPVLLEHRDTYLPHKS